MNLQHLRYFLKVMETGSVSRAADLLGLTQPTLSLALKRVEQEFGVRLFAPDGRGIRPLASAKLLEDRVRLAVRVLSEAKRDLSGSAPAALNIGILPSLAENWLPRLGNAWDGPVAIVEALSDELEKQVKGGAVDLALTALSPGERLPRRVLFHEPYMLFVGAMHLFAGRRTVGLAELDRQPFVLRQCCERLGSGRRLFEQAHVRFKVVAKTRQEATAAALVAAGVGCTLAPKSWLHPDLRAVKVEGLSLGRTVGLMWKTKANEGRVAGIARSLEASMISDTPVRRSGRLRDGSRVRAP
jgi:DNA-binding transcriptional LysR family regulator